MPTLDELNRPNRLANFPPDRRWKQITGAMIQPRSDVSHPPLVSIMGLDHKGEVVRFWTDLPNAMYLMNILSQFRSDHRSAVPSSQPPECVPYDGAPW